MTGVFQFDVVMALFVIAGLSLINSTTRRIALVMVACWVLQTMTVRWFCGVNVFDIFGNIDSPAPLSAYAPWQAFFLLNAAASLAILVPPYDRIRALIGSLFIIQVIVDLGFGLAKNLEMTKAYLTLQTDILWVQLIALGAYGGGSFLRYIWNNYISPVGKTGNKGVAR